MAVLDPQPGEPDCKAPACPLQAADYCFGTGLSPHSSMLAEPPLMLASLQAFSPPARTQLQPLQSAIHLLSKYLLRVYDVPRTVLGVRDTKINKMQSWIKTSDRKVKRGEKRKEGRKLCKQLTGLGRRNGLAPGPEGSYGCQGMVW